MVSLQDTRNVLKKLLNLSLLYVWAGFAGAAQKCEAQPIITATDLIVGQGYPAELHRAWTADAFELSIHRIPPKNVGSRAVLMMHGVFVNAGSWVANLPFNDLAFMLHDAGWDVWMGNFRGTVYSTFNTNYTQKQREYWDFSWIEMAKYDVPACIDYILKFTGHEKLSLVCHSEGCAASLTTLATLPEVADKVGILMALAPAAFVGHTTSLPAVIGQKLDIGDRLASREIWHVNGLTPLAEVLLTEFCSSWPGVCAITMQIMMGWDLRNVNASRMDVYLQVTDGTSTKNLQHGFQAMDTNRFAYYNYSDPNTNRDLYGQVDAPDIPLWNITNKIALYYGSHDTLVTPYDIENSLIPALSSAAFVQRPVSIPFWNHADFVFSMDGSWYQKMVGVLDKWGV